MNRRSVSNAPFDDARRRLIRSASLCAATLLPAAAARAATPADAASTTPSGSATAWPAGRPITWVVPYPPGGSTDVLGRSLSKAIGTLLDTQVVVDNRPGAAGTIGSAFVARSAPNGLTVLGTTIGPQSIAPHLMPRLPYRPLVDLAPVCLISTMPHLLVLPAKSPLDSLAALVAAARQRPGTVSYASAGAGTILQMQPELLAHNDGLSLVHVPYKGDTPALQDTLAGVVDFMFAPVAPAMPHVRSGALRVLAITSARRLAVLPEVPTMIELGHPGFVTEQWQAAYVPRETPEPVVQRLHRAIAEALRESDVRALAGRLGIALSGEGPEVLARRQQTDSDTWGALIRARGIRAD